MSVTVVMDGQAGSCGKGKFIGHLARYAYENQIPMHAIDNFMTNAGHTFVFDDGRKVVSQHIPTSVVNPHAMLMIGPGAAIDMPTLESELTEYADLLRHRMVYVHPRAMVILPEHAEKERQVIKSGSTFKGCGAACADKIMRVPGVALFAEARESFRVTFPTIYKKTKIEQTHICLNNAIDADDYILVEGSQGFDLDINYGLQYPHTTSRQCNAAQLVADCGIAPTMVTGVLMVIRPYPIRINNQSTEGERYSGDYAGSEEITWDEIKKRCGAPDDVEFGEMTTVTKRLRRVFEFNWDRLSEAVMVNRPSEIALNFAQYLDWNARGMTEWNQLPKKVFDFITDIERIAQVPVTMVGTGAKNSEICIHPLYRD